MYTHVRVSFDVITFVPNTLLFVVLIYAPSLCLSLRTTMYAFSSI